jgi:hypothetical protein
MDLCAGTLQGQKHSAQVFCLAVLLSSVFVYNQLGAIDSVAIERLAMVCELAKRIKNGARGQADFHPAFIWLLRDFQLLLQVWGRAATALCGLQAYPLQGEHSGVAAMAASTCHVHACCIVVACSYTCGDLQQCCDAWWAVPVQEGNKQLTPLEYLENTLNHIAGTEADVASKNQVGAVGVVQLVWQGSCRVGCNYTGIGLQRRVCMTRGPRQMLGLPSISCQTTQLLNCTLVAGHRGAGYGAINRIAMLQLGQHSRPASPPAPHRPPWPPADRCGPPSRRCSL